MLRPRLLRARVCGQPYRRVAAAHDVLCGARVLHDVEAQLLAEVQRPPELLDRVEGLSAVVEEAQRAHRRLVRAATTGRTAATW